jgi:hypothetical protein
MNITHPYFDAVALRRSGGGNLPSRKANVGVAMGAGAGGTSNLLYPSSPGGPFSPAPTYGDHRRLDKKTSYTTTTMGTSPYDVEDDEFRTHFSTSASLGTTPLDLNDDRAFSTSSSRYLLNNTSHPVGTASTRFNNRSISMASSGGLGLGLGSCHQLMNRTESLLSNVSMNPMAKSTLILFLELFTGLSLPYPSLLFDQLINPSTHQGGGVLGDASGHLGTISNASTSPYSSYTGKSTSIDTNITFQSSSNTTTTQQQFTRYTAHHLTPTSHRPSGAHTAPIASPMPGAMMTMMMTTSSSFYSPSSPPIISVSMNIKPSLLSLSIDAVFHTSVGNGIDDNTDILCLRTKSGVVTFQASLPHSIPNSSDQPTRTAPQYVTKKLSAKRYNGNLIVSNGRIYCLTRGASMSGWLQKWPMR